MKKAGEQQAPAGLRVTKREFTYGERTTVDSLIHE